MLDTINTPKENQNQRIHFESIVLSLATDFINPPKGDFDSLIKHTLRLVGGFIEVDCAGIYLYSSDKSRAECVWEWSAKKTSILSDMIPAFSFEKLSWWLEQLNQSINIKITSLDELPTEAKNEKRFFDQIKYQSILAIPLMGKNSIGFVFLGTLTKRKEWLDVEISLVYILGIFFAEAYHKRRLKEELQETEKRLHLLVNASFEGIVLNDQGKIIEVNSAFLNMFGYNLNEALGKNFLDLIAPEFRELMLNHIQSKKDQSETFLGLKKDGTKFPLEITDKELPYHGRKIRVSVLRDITNYKKTENTLKSYADELKRLNQSKDRLFSIIAHDLKNPLNNLVGLSSLLVEDIDSMSRTEISDMAKRIHISGDRMFHLIDDLLQWASVQSDKMKFIARNLNLRDVIEDNATLLFGEMEQKHLEWINLIPDTYIVYVDRHMLDCIVRNLITNAIKFNIEGGAIKAMAKPHGNKFAVLISDTGVGINEFVTEKLFKLDESFSTQGTAKEKGTGLGLILCKELVKKLDGQIWVERNPDQGSTFTFTLPSEQLDFETY